MAFFSKWRSKRRRSDSPQAPYPCAPPGPPEEKTVPGNGPNPCPAVQDDTILVTLPLLTISLTRKLGIDVPHEVTVIVPRAEMRFKEGEAELIYSSITVVHAPRHPLAGERPPGGESGTISTAGPAGQGHGGAHQAAAPADVQPLSLRSGAPVRINFGGRDFYPP